MHAARCRLRGTRRGDRVDSPAPPTATTTPTCATPSRGPFAAGRFAGPPSMATTGYTAASELLRARPCFPPSRGFIDHAREAARFFLLHQIEECLLGLLAHAADTDERNLVFV